LLTPATPKPKGNDGGKGANGNGRDLTLTISRICSNWFSIRCQPYCVFPQNGLRCNPDHFVGINEMVADQNCRRKNPEGISSFSPALTRSGYAGW
jgi:hypothetical protein